MRNASVHARPTSISGVALTSVSEKTSTPPNDERAIWAYAATGLPPASASMTAPMISASTTAPNEVAAGSQSWGFAGVAGSQFSGKEFVEVGASLVLMGFRMYEGYKTT